MTNRPFPWVSTFIVGFGFFGISMLWPLFNSFIPPMLEHLGLAPVLVGFIMTWDNIINMFFQPVVGSISDRTMSPLGRRKPFLLVGAPLAALFFLVVPFVRENLVLIALAILGTNLAMALFRSPTVAYLGDLFRPGERSRANGVINLMGGLAGAIALLVGGILYRIGVPIPFIFGSAVMAMAIAVVILFVREPSVSNEPQRDATQPSLLSNLRSIATGPDRSGLALLAAIFCWFMAWNAVEAFFTLYVNKMMGIEVGPGAMMLTIFAAMLILFSIPSGLIATRFGRKPTILVGLAGMFGGLVLAFLLRNPTLLMVLLGVMGAFWALVNINSLPMVLDLGGQKSIGGLTGLYYFSSSAAAIGGPILSGGLVTLAANNYGMIWLFAAVFMALAIVCMSRVQSARAPSLFVEQPSYGGLR